MGPKRQGWSPVRRHRSASGRGTERTRAPGRGGRRGRAAGPGRPAGGRRAERRFSRRSLWAAAALTAAGLCLAPLLAGCGSDHAAPAPGSTVTSVLLQAATAPGPGPYTDSTARGLPAPAPQPPAGTGSGQGAPLRGQTLRTVSGATPGLYGGIEAIGSCDAGRLLALLRSDRSAARAFARGAGVGEAGVGGFLGGLTPVVLRADTRVGTHRYRDGEDRVQQAVLQAGSAVLVDRYGVPRVRCAGGNPLSAPLAARGPVAHEGTPWRGFRPERSVVVRPADRVLDRLVLLDIVDGSWIERRTGSDGEHDTRPDPLPPVVSDDLYSYPPTGAGDGSAPPVEDGLAGTVPPTAVTPGDGSGTGPVPDPGRAVDPAPLAPPVGTEAGVAGVPVEPYGEGVADPATTELLLPGTEPGAEADSTDSDGGTDGVIGTGGSAPGAR
ncbi:DUF6777 domain-containing protein [Streptomyces sp. NPDC000594]|uniref:DUF6777 domain-containing protein n=1 Tax=Streptomyces sp. NPDC000594 TaxID=3154261 RepID=UPI0033188996